MRQIMMAVAGVTWIGIHAALASATLTLSGPTDRAVYQRSDVNSASVPVVGTFTGTVTRIEARAVMGIKTTPWTVIDAAPSGGSFSSTLSVGGGGWYDVEVRTMNGPSETDFGSVSQVGVGEVFVMAGQSNSANFGSPQQTPGDLVSALTSSSTGVWQHAADPQPIASGSGGSPWPDLGDALVADLDVPIGVISVGQGGTRVDQWLPTGGLYPRIRDALQFLGPNGARAVLWHQGESDSLASTSSSTYASRLNSIIAQSRVDAGWDVPWGVAIASYHPSSSAAQEAQVAAGQQLVIDGDPLVFKGAETDDFHNIGYLSDSVHFNDAGLLAHGQQWADALNQAFSFPTVPSFPLGDLNMDEVVDELDWPIFLAGNQAGLAGLSPKDAYLMGDLNFDGVNDVTDFDIFVAAFNAAQGEGAFTEMISTVPEPSTGILIGLCGLALTNGRSFMVRQQICNRSTSEGGLRGSMKRAVMLCTFAMILGDADIASAELTLSQPKQRAIFQRDADDKADLPISGTISPSATRIEARAVAMQGGNGKTTDWKVINVAPSQGKFSGRLSVPAGSWYDIEVRAMNGASEIDSESVSRVGVGEVFVIAGQSNSANFGQPPQKCGERVSALASTKTGEWQRANDPQPIANGSGGSPWPDFADALVAELDVPVGFISVGIGATSVGQWLPDGKLYPRLRDALRFLGPNGARAVLWHQGESDSLASTSSATYASRLSSIIAQSRIDADWDVPWGVAIASYHPASSATQEAQVAAGQQLVIEGDPLVFKGAETNDFHSLGYLSDSVHFNDAGLLAHGQQWAAKIKELYFSPASGQSQGIRTGITSP